MNTEMFAYFWYWKSTGFSSLKFEINLTCILFKSMRYTETANYS